MAEKTTKKVSVGAAPKVNNSDGMLTFGTYNIHTAFDAASSYEIGDCVYISGTEPLERYRFKKRHVAGQPFSASEVVTSTVLPSTVKVDMGRIDFGVKRLEKMAAAPEAGNYIMSFGEKGRYGKYTIKVRGREDSFIPSGILVTATPENGSASDRIFGRTGSDGICELELLRDTTYEIETERIAGWEAKCPSGRTFRMTPYILNYDVRTPTKFLSSWDYNISETVSYEGLPYRFTAKHPKGPWNAAHVERIEIRENILEFVYRKCIDENVRIKLVTEYSGGKPLSGVDVLAFSGDYVTWSKGKTNLSGEWEFEMPKNSDFSVLSPTSLSSIPWDYGKRFYDITTVADRDKTVKATFPTGLFWVCGETATSIADGTAWREFAIEDYPMDPITSWENGHPALHPPVLLHVATDELVSKKFDHRSMTLCAASDNPIRITASEQVFPWKGTPYDASYYVRIADLTTERSRDVATGRQWCSQNLLHPHVTTSRSYNELSSYDGALMTSWIKYDSDNMLQTTDATPVAVAASSQAANYALSQTAQLGSRTLSGFIGTYMQMNPLFLLSEPIYDALGKFGYVGNFKTGTYWWSGTQTDAWYAWDFEGWSPIWLCVYKNRTWAAIINFFL